MPTSERVGKAERHQKPLPPHNAQQSGENTNSQLLSKEPSVRTTHLGHHFWHCCPRAGPKTSSSWKPMGLDWRTPQYYNKYGTICLCFNFMFYQLISIFCFQACRGRASDQWVSLPVRWPEHWGLRARPLQGPAGQVRKVRGRLQIGL